MKKIAWWKVLGPMVLVMGACGVEGAPAEMTASEDGVDSSEVDPAAVGEPGADAPSLVQEKTPYECCMNYCMPVHNFDYCHAGCSGG